MKLTCHICGGQYSPNIDNTLLVCAACVKRAADLASREPGERCPCGCPLRGGAFLCAICEDDANAGLRRQVFMTEERIWLNAPAGTPSIIFDGWIRRAP